MRIDLRIDRVVLTGLDLPARQLPAFREALQAELTRLFTAAPPATRRSHHTRRLAATGHLSAGSGPDHLARHTAREIHRGLGRSR